MKNVLCLCVLSIVILGCMNTSSKGQNDLGKERLNKFEEQMSLLLDDALTANRNPRTIDDKGEVHWTNTNFDWTEGFFPGSCWYLYEFTNDEKWKQAAEKIQAQFENHKYLTTNHDLGFVFNCSYGNGYRLTKNDHFKEVLITAADSLLSRFNPTVGCIKSWDVDRGWQSQRNWMFPVIIDNMMNLELLFEVSALTGNDTYKQVAISHADTTLKNHFRTDNSSYHVVDYNPDTGEVRGKQTAQGFADNSSWARGQAWGLYGYTLCYRYTKDKKYLEQAQKIAQYILEYPDMPSDLVPYWDYNAPNRPNEPRDVSAAAITASALIELSNYSNKSYSIQAEKILDVLASEKYTATIGTNKHFVLKHSVGSIPHKNEIDVPLNYADYYYLEALMRHNSSKI